MSDLKQMIKNVFDKDRGVSKKIAEIAGLKNPTPLYKFLNEPGRELDSFYSLLKVVRALFPDRELELMENYLRTVDPNKKTARVGLEYAQVNNLTDLSDELIGKLCNSKNNESKEWGNIYALNRELGLSKENLISKIDKLRALKLKTDEMKAFSKMIKIYHLFNRNMYESMKEVAEATELMVDSIKDEFIRSSYLSRLGIVQINIAFHNNETDKVREYGHKVLEKTTVFGIKSLMYLFIGNSYIIENYDLSRKYLLEGLCACSPSHNTRRRQIESSLNFLNNYWGIAPEYLDYNSENTSDLHEVAFFYVREGRIIEATEVLNKVKLDDLTPQQLGFHYFYRGLVSGIKKDFYQSLKNFKVSGEKYYVQLPLIELKKLGDSDELLEVLAI